MSEHEDALRVAAQLKEQAQQEMTQMRKRAESDIGAARQQAITAIYEQAAALSTQIAGQILRREIDPATHRTLVDDSLKEMSAKRN